MKTDRLLNIENTISVPRWRTYKDLSSLCSMKRSPEELYKMNIIYSKELYVMIGGLEIALRNQFHRKISEKYSEQWFDKIKLGNIHKKQLDDAKDKSAKKKKDYNTGDIISELNFGFWVHLLNRPYEQILWNKCLSRAFPNHIGKPKKKELMRKLLDILTLRNKIAHLEPIIRNEKELMDRYHDIYSLISWICPDTADWFSKISEFNKIYALKLERNDDN